MTGNGLGRVVLGPVTGIGKGLLVKLAEHKVLQALVKGVVTMGRVSALDLTNDRVIEKITKLLVDDAEETEEEGQNLVKLDKFLLPNQQEALNKPTTKTPRKRLSTIPKQLHQDSRKLFGLLRVKRDYVADEHDQGLEMVFNRVRLDLEDGKGSLEVLVLLEELFTVGLRVSFDEILELGIVEGQVAGGSGGFAHFTWLVRAIRKSLP